MKNKKKWVYFFGQGKAEGQATMKELLGGKGANLAEMTNIKLPVPPGFTISTEVCDYFSKNDHSYPEGLDEEFKANLEKLEKTSGKKFGDASNPLLVSVRSGAAVSMPGMMDTILNLGLNDKTVEGLAAKSSNERFAWDSYRRFIQMFGNVVKNIEHKVFEHELEKVKKEAGVEEDKDIPADKLKKLVASYKVAFKEKTGKDFPQDVNEQLADAVKAVFLSWDSERANKYREINKITGLLGTAVNVVAMVFGNMGDDSGTGVCFTRNPSNGENIFYGEFLQNAQGEDVVAGIRTPQPIAELEKVNKKIYDQLLEVRKILEKHYKDMQDIEFTIEKGILYILQTRNGKRTANAAIQIAVDLVKEKFLTEEQALLKVDPEQLNQLLHPTFDPKVKYNVIAKGLNASPGAAVGKIIFNSKKAEEIAMNGEKVMLVRAETSPEDLGGMHTAQGILTARGGMTSHAAVVTRAMGKPCIVGCSAVSINEEAGTCKIGLKEYKEGDYISINGTTGEIIDGQVPLVQPDISQGNFKVIMDWANRFRKLRVRANADTPKDCETSLYFGAEGVGLTRTEHMFFEGDRIIAVREMILAEDLESRKKPLAKLLAMQKQDFKEMLKIMDGLPVTIRLLDPPLHEFLPRTEEDLQAVAKELKVDIKKLKAKNESLHEFNPMMGHRGCRLGITFPEIYEMQAQAIFEAVAELHKEGIKVFVEVMIPLVGMVTELVFLKKRIKKIADEILKKNNADVPYKIGTMIEIPRAALTADIIAAEAEFFSFGTNDLTQMTFGFSRDDAGHFLGDYKEREILTTDPFVSLDVQGVGQLIEMAVKKGKSVRKDLKTGICGEHGGDPKSIEFCHKAGLEYVSCSPYRVPVAILAAAQAAVKENLTKK
ncbi:MAG: pyruvate, phosphate dikinase [Spirochaetes bacterium GWB1_36_13]|nr:MAG: pyruvate, phosphate dikinase [Spirochaetes bacterium GWB1_36_13]